MAFVKFTETGKSFATKVSISVRGTISFNDGARRKFELNKFDFVVLYFDKEANSIGLEFTNSQTAEGSMKIRKRKTGADIGARSFLSCFDIMPNITTIYIAKTGEREGWVEIDLSKGKARKSRSTD